MTPEPETDDKCPLCGAQVRWIEIADLKFAFDPAPAPVVHRCPDRKRIAAFTQPS